MRFVLGATDITLDDPAQYPQKEKTELIQASIRSASGVNHVESFDVQIGLWTYNFKDMSSADHTALLGFHVNDAEGKMNEFSLTNDLGSTDTVQFTESFLDFQLDYYGLWSGSFTVEEVQ